MLQGWTFYLYSFLTKLLFREKGNFQEEEIAYTRTVLKLAGFRISVKLLFLSELGD